MENNLNLNPINLYEYEKRAELILPHDNWDFIAAGAMDLSLIHISEPRAQRGARMPSSA